MDTSNSALPEDIMPALPRGSLSASARGVCRSLFGPIDHDELRSELKRQLKEIQASDCQRWNFDFEAGTPLRGTFCWEPLESKETPNFYRESRLCPGTAAPVPRLQQQQTPGGTVPPVPADSREEAPAEAVRKSQSPECAKENAAKAGKRCQGVKGPATKSPSSSSSSSSSSHSSLLLRKREISTSITDYFPKRKRIQVAKIDTLKVSHPFCTLEQTPRKKIR
ncbi:cyclin-dependent kinase inhibitor 1B-like [Pseudophryne corroboree]|uniref:cyclin-dependent kinase inhibitor 1B-like n=1 Tax=Pseudophryne corroboree TaxID=495146 RepID=UPI0030818DC8